MASMHPGHGRRTKVFWFFFSKKNILSCPCLQIEETPMTYGAVLARFDVAQIAIYIFWGSFFALIWYLRREDHREGYPLVGDYKDQDIYSIPPLPTPKTFITADGHEVQAPRPEPAETSKLQQVLPWAGAPFVPTGNPLVDGVGPAAYANRADVPDHAYDDGLPKIVPLRKAADFFLAAEDTDPRDFEVFANDDKLVGHITDVWIDRAEYIIRYLEMSRLASFGGGTVILPSTFVKINNKRHEITCNFLRSDQFATVPQLKNPDVITLLEEDRLMGYFAGGQLYGKASRTEPVL
jgi:photosynthetic reaction center H subunit